MDRKHIDTLARFLLANTHDNGRVPLGILFSVLGGWCRANGADRPPYEAVAAMLANAGYQVGKEGQGRRIVHGLRLRERT